MAMACGQQNTRSDDTWLSGSGKSNLSWTSNSQIFAQRRPEVCFQIAQRLPMDSPRIALRLLTYCKLQIAADCSRIAHRSPSDCRLKPAWILAKTSEF